MPEDDAAVMVQSDPAPQQEAISPKPDYDESAARIRQDLAKVRSELEELRKEGYGGFYCTTGSTDSEVKFTPDQKAALRADGVDPDELEKKMEALRVEHNAKRALWRDLTKSEEELELLVEVLEQRTRN